MYIDESGSIKPMQKEFYVITGVIIHESDVQDIERHIEKYKLTNFEKCDIEIHTFHMWNGSGEFEIYHVSQRRLHLRNLYKAINLFPITIIGVVIDKIKMNSPNFINWNLLKTAWTFMAERFDMFLQENEQKGMIIVDSNTKKPNSEIHAIITKIKRNGSDYHDVRNILEQPLFADSKDSVGLQIADSISYSIYKNFCRSPYEDFYENYVYSKYRRNIYTNEVLGYGLKVFPN